MLILVYVLWQYMCLDALNGGIEATPLQGDNMIDITNNNIEEEGSVEHKGIFAIPTTLKLHTSIIIEGKMSSIPSDRMIFSLVTKDRETAAPDFKNVACQLVVDFRNNIINANAISNGTQTIIETGTPATGLFSQKDSNFEISFHVEFANEEITSILISANGMVVMSCDLLVTHRIVDIAYLTFEGVDEVNNFTFMQY